MKKTLAIIGIVISMLLLLVRSNTSLELQSYESPISQEATPLIRCGPMAGTAFAIGLKTLVTAAHVVKSGSCVLKKDAFDRFPSSVKVIYVDTFNDYAILQAKKEIPDHYTIDCSGYVGGDQYTFAGYPFGGEFRVDAGLAQANNMGVRNRNGTVRIVRNIDGLSIEGMSGGPVVNQDGQVVGLISGKMKVGPDQVVTVPITLTTLCGGNGSAG